MAVIIFCDGKAWQSSARIMEYVCEECLRIIEDGPHLRDVLFQASIYHTLRLDELSAEELIGFSRAVSKLLAQEDSRHVPGLDAVDDLRYKSVVARIRELNRLLSGS